MSFQTVTRSDWTWNHIRPVAFWVTTFVVVFELAAGSVWNLMTIEWIEVQMRHVGYPYYFAYISGGWQAAAAVAIIAPRFPRRCPSAEWSCLGA